MVRAVPHHYISALDARDTFENGDCGQAYHTKIPFRHSCLATRPKSFASAARLLTKLKSTKMQYTTDHVLGDGHELVHSSALRGSSWQLPY